MAEIMDLNVILKRINNDLTSAKTRDKGITALLAYLPECPDETFSNNCVNWMTHCCKNDDGNPKSVITACQTLRQLLLTSAKFSELKKSVSNFINTRFFDHFLKYLTDSEDGWLCAEACFSSFKGACGPYEAKIKETLWSLISRNIKISSTIADCYALLPSLGGGGHGNVNYKVNWKNQFSNVIKSTHGVLNQLFSNVIEMQKYDTKDDNSDELESASHDHLIALLHNYCLVLGAMLKNKYLVSKPIPVDAVMNLICRGLAVTQKTLGNQLTSDIISLKNLIPQIHIILYSLLSALIVTCKTNLYPYAHLICKLFKQTLEWTESDYKYGSDKPFAPLRIAVYSALSNWIVAAKSGCCAESISSAVIFAFRKDVIPQKPTVLLQGTEKAKEAKLNEKMQVNRVNEYANAKLCFSALRSMQLYVKYVGIFLKREEHSELQNAIVRELMEIQCAPALSDISIPYTVSSCRLELYSALLVVTVTPHAHYPPPTQFALRIFSQGLNDKHPQISKFCASALNDITNIIHPSFKVSTFPITFNAVKTTTAVKFPKESERSVDLVWRESKIHEENVEEPMEVDQTVTDLPGPESDGEAVNRNKEKDLIEFSMVEINELRECLKESPEKIALPEISPKKLSVKSPEKQEQVQKSPRRESPRKQAQNKSPEKSSAVVEVVDLEDRPEKQVEENKLESPKKASPRKEIEIAEVSSVEESPKKVLEEKIKSPVRESPRKGVEEKIKSPVKESPEKKLEDKVESSKKASPAKQQELEKSGNIAKQQISESLGSTTTDKPDSPKKTSPVKLVKSPEKIVEEPESPKKASPTKFQNIQDSEDPIPEEESTPVVEDESATSETSESPVRRSTRVSKNTEKVKSDGESPKTSPSPKRRKIETVPEKEETSPAESDLNTSDSTKKSTEEAENKVEGMKAAVVKITKLSDLKYDGDESISEDKRYNLRRKQGTKVEEGDSSTPKRGRPPRKSTVRSERSSSSESGTSRTSKRIAEKPKEDDIMELFDESLNPKD